MQGTPQGVTGADARDGDVTPSRAEAFWSKGRLLEPVIGSWPDGTRVSVFFDGGDTFQIKFGDFNHETLIWTTRKGLAAMASEAMSALVRADIALDAANGVPGTYVPREVHEDDVPW